MDTYYDDLWDTDYDDLDMIELAKKHDMVILDPESLHIPKWGINHCFNSPEQLKQFLRLYDTGVFDHLSQNDFYENALYGAREYVRIMQL